jgi:hypothetical protein
MDQERFDQLARAVSSGSSRRTILGGVIAGLFGAGAARLTDVAAKGKHKKRSHKKGPAKHKKRKGGARAQEVIGPCEGATDPTNCPAGCCRPVGAAFECVANGTDGLCGIGGVACQALTGSQCCDATSGARVSVPAGNCGGRDSAAGYPGGLCTPCPNGCCGGTFSLITPGRGLCIENGDGRCGLGGVYCDSAASCSVAVSGTPSGQCCTADGGCASGSFVQSCGSGRHLCEVCTGINPTCISGACQSGAPCPPPQTACNGSCFDLGTNPAHCGSCDNACPACVNGGKPVCQGGTCGCTEPPPPCPGALTACNGLCIDVASNPDNCGACGVACVCPAGTKPLCQGGACACTDPAAPCPGDLKVCDGLCVDLSTNVLHCGACNIACPGCLDGGQPFCQGGACGCTEPPAPCPPPLSACGDLCVDLGTNPENCGACGNVCPGCGKRRQIVCQGGACGCSQKRRRRRRHRRHHKH